MNMLSGARRLLDTHQCTFKNSPTVYLRIRNFPDVQGNDAVQLGFTLTPATGPTGVTDIKIEPPPTVDAVSVHNIGMSEGKLRFGAKKFTVSANFVDKQKVAQGLSDSRKVWEGSQVVGLVMGNVLFSIENIDSQFLSGGTLLWTLTCNANTLR